MKYKINNELGSDYIREKYFGNTFKTNHYGSFKVLGIHDYNETYKNTFAFVIEFTSTGAQKLSTVAHITRGDIADPSVDSGAEYDCEINLNSELDNYDGYVSKHPMYDRWYSMFSRSHNKNDNQYRPKGEVHQLWQSFQRFLDDCPNIIGYKEMIENPDIQFHIDKDLFGNGKMLYSPDTCCFIPHSINTILGRERKTHQNKKHKQGYHFMGVASSGTLKFRFMGHFQGERFTIPTHEDKYVVHSMYWDKKREIVRKYCNEVYPFLDKRIEDRLIEFFNKREKYSLSELKRADEDGLFNQPPWNTRRDRKSEPYHQKQLKKNKPR